MLSPRGLAPFPLGIWTGPFPIGGMDPFPVGDMDRPLSLTQSPISPSVMRFRAARCIYVYCETGMPCSAHGDTFNRHGDTYVSVVEHHFLPLVSSDLFCYLLWSSALGTSRVFYTRSTGLWVPAKVVGLLHDGHVELEVVCKPSISDAPWTPSPLVSPVSSLHHHPHQFPQWTSL